MKKMLAVGVILGFVAASNAALQIEWSANDGFVRNDGITPIFDGGAGSYLAQLIWTPDAFISTAGPMAAVTGNEQLLTEMVVSYSGDDYGFFPGQFYAGSFPGVGNVYARVFDVGSDVKATIIADTWYYAGPLLAGTDEAVNTIYQAYNIHDGTGPFEPTFQTSQLNLQVVVPEPSVLALLGLGVVGLIARRRFIK